MEEATRIARDLQRLRGGDETGTTPSKRLINADVDEGFMMSAAAHPHGAWIFEVFMEAAGPERLPTVTEEVTLQATRNSVGGAGIISVLYKWCLSSNTKLPVTEEVMITALKASNSRLVAALLNGPPSSVNDEVREASESSPSGSRQDSWPSPRALEAGEIPVTEKVMVAAVETGSTDFLRELVSVRREERLPVIHNIALAVASSQDGDILMRFFQWNQYASDRISEEVVVIALANGWLPYLRTEEIEVRGCDEEDAVMVLSRRLARLLREMDIRDEYFAAVSARLAKFPAETRWRRTIGDARTLLDVKGRNALPATEWAVKVAIQLALQGIGEGFKMLRCLMDKYGDELPITERVVLAAVEMDEMSRHGHEDKCCGREEVFKLLVDHTGIRLPVSNRVLVAAVGRGCQGVLKLLLKTKADELEITEDVLQAARGECTGGEYS
ncbi:hypothetical protein QBC34DRAFT_151705 [Podospora aff. communis PSN243]|uniref:Uncharacterized protein n=1 Tax=Podospora aff. communis PSN243 TaxID=3040156 RepID=A0AAV9GFT1_9PEZI|nr:hypothetical protein QBC34DRAFT_151705 [Podospora aff. communis PSN243]